MNFNDLSLQSSGLLANIQAMGFEEATPIQRDVIPLALEGRDISGLSRTGTGKTCAFLIPAVDRLEQLEPDRIVLCLAPTRELALQIEAEAKKLTESMELSSTCLVGGMPMKEQVQAIKAGARIITGTPGRVMDFIRSGLLPAEKVSILVFDEADRMFDMGFIDDMRFILQKVDRDRQILLFSATMNFSVLNMIYEFHGDPVEINISRDQITAEGIQQQIFQVSDHEKPAALIHLCRQVESGGIIVFVNFREKVLWVAKLLELNGIRATGISSLLRQDKRNKILRDFRENKFQALVATDVASRGLDINDVALVVNYHLPEEAANYVHRIGRTARAGRSGKAVAIAGPDDGYNQLRIEEFLGSKIPTAWFDEKDLAIDVVLPDRQRRDRGGRDSRSRDNRRGSSSHSGNAPDRKDRNDSDRDDKAESSRQNAAPEQQDEEGTSDVNDAKDSGAQRRSNRRSRGRGRGRDRNNRGRDSSQGRSRDGHQDRDRSHAKGGNQRDNRQSNRPRRSNRGRSQGRGADNATPPYPITGNPTVYCTKTGKPKNDPVNAPKNGSSIDPEKRVNLLRKIGTTVTSIFGRK